MAIVSEQDYSGAHSFLCGRIRWLWKCLQQTFHEQSCIGTDPNSSRFRECGLASTTCQSTKPLNGRQRYLIAVPVLGTGGSGGADITGQVVDHMLRELQTLALHHQDVDFVLVCADTATLTHTQHTRYKLWRRAPSFQLLIKGDRIEEAKWLEDLSSKGQLSLFLGAGVSVGSGLPTWFQFLNFLEDQFTPSGLPDERSLGDQCHWDPLSMAEQLEQMAANRPDRHGVKMPLKQRAQVFLQERSINPGLLLYLILGLKPSSIVTQNYDTLIEQAYECRSLAENQQYRNEAISVIPYKPLRGSSRWLLKMHGCVTNPDDIVLTKSDYETFEAGRFRTLSGSVQANLMTSHFLFCGFSMKDPNYLRILEEVRHALNPDAF